MYKGGELKKLTIEAFSDAEYKKSLGPEFIYTALVNPERYSSSHKTEFEIIQGSGSSDAVVQFKKSAPKELDLELLFDRTGVFSNYPPDEKEGVLKDIERFQDVALEFNGGIHQPNYVVISWGRLLFKGRLMDMNVEYKLFNSGGAPIRAVAKVKFISATDEDLIQAKEKKNSPDLTHVRIVKEGDTLPLMTYRVYGDSKYYLEVAKVNKLSSFRKLIVGQEIVFPPVQKVGING
jgi:hypothetical protein